MKRPSFIYRFIEAIPLPVFLVYSRLIDDPTVAENWLGPYLSSTALALVTSGYLLREKILLNRCFIGINLYFLIGAIGVLAELSTLNKLLGTLEASAMLACIVLVGLISTFVGSAGFVGINIPDKKRLRLFSILLIAVAIAATIMSYIFRGNPLQSELLPFVALFSCMNLFRTYLNSANTF
jgi:hypothetical protein